MAVFPGLGHRIEAAGGIVDGRALVVIGVTVTV